ncbi:MAG TPA: hypothetical protein ENI07_15695 [Desulfobacterales bacterium]|nr:hypothetical protein [Desulfobacterales bacterium]
MIKNRIIEKLFKHTVGFATVAFLFCGVVFLIVPEAGGAEIVDRIVAVVNDDIISMFEMNQKVKPFTERVKTLDYPAEQKKILLLKIREDVLNRLIDEKLADQEIKRVRINVSEKEVDNAIERFKETNDLTDERLKEALKRDGISMVEYRKHIRDQVLRGKLVNREVQSKIVITKADIEAYYKQHPEDYAGKKKFRLRHIIMRVPSGADKDDRLSVQKKMETVQKELKAGHPFEKMAKIYSEISGETGGVLGLFELDDLSLQVKEAITGIKPGEFTDILETDHGYQIFFLEEIINSGGKQIEEVSSEIESKLHEEIVNNKYQSWLKDLRKRSHIKIMK